MPRWRAMSLLDLLEGTGIMMLTAGAHSKIANDRLGQAKVGIAMDLYHHHTNP